MPGPGLARGTRATDACGFREQPGARPLLHARRVVATPRSCSTRGAVTELVGHRSVEPHTPPRRRGGHRPAAPPPTRLAGTCVRPPTTGISSHLFPGNSAAAVTRAALPPPPSLSSPVGSLRVSNAATRDTNRATPADGTSHRHRPRSPRPIQTGPRNTGSSAAATPCDPPPPRRAAPLRSAPRRRAPAPPPRPTPTPPPLRHPPPPLPPPPQTVTPATLYSGSPGAARRQRKNARSGVPMVVGASKIASMMSLSCALHRCGRERPSGSSVGVPPGRECARGTTVVVMSGVKGRPGGGGIIGR